MDAIVNQIQVGHVGKQPASLDGGLRSVTQTYITAKEFQTTGSRLT